MNARTVRDRLRSTLESLGRLLSRSVCLVRDTDQYATVCTGCDVFVIPLDPPAMIDCACGGTSLTTVTGGLRHGDCGRCGSLLVAQAA